MLQQHLDKIAFSYTNLTHIFYCFFLFTYTVFYVSRLPYKMLLQSCILYLSVDSGSRSSPRFSSGKKQSSTEELPERDDDSSVEYSCSEEKSRDDELSSDYDTTVVGEEEANAAIGSDEDSVLDEVQNHRQAFYRYYNEYYERVKGSTHLITNAKYDEIVSILQREKVKGECGVAYKYRKYYELRGNVTHRNLYREGKVVTTYERVFDVIWEAHASISHLRDPRTHKNLLKETYFGIPETCIKFFLKCCPVVSVVGI